MFLGRVGEGTGRSGGMSIAKPYVLSLLFERGELPVSFRKRLLGLRPVLLHLLFVVVVVLVFNLKLPPIPGRFVFLAHL